MATASPLRRPFPAPPLVPEMVFASMLPIPASWEMEGVASSTFVRASAIATFPTIPATETEHANFELKPGRFVPLKRA